MLPPEELSKVEFSKSIRGYNPEEVDKHIEFIVSNYTELYKQFQTLKHKYNALDVQYNRIKSYEEAIKNSLINAQSASSKLLNETNERAEEMIKEAERKCRCIVGEYENKIKYQQYIIKKMNDAVDAFKQELYSKYTSHIENIENITSGEISADEFIKAADELDETVMRDVYDNDKRFNAEQNAEPDKSIFEDDNTLNIIAAVNDIIEAEKQRIDRENEIALQNAKAEEQKNISEQATISDIDDLSDELNEAEDASAEAIDYTDKETEEASAEIEIKPEIDDGKEAKEAIPDFDFGVDDVDIDVEADENSSDEHITELPAVVNKDLSKHLKTAEQMKENTLSAEPEKKAEEITIDQSEFDEIFNDNASALDDKNSDTAKEPFSDTDELDSEIRRLLENVNNK